jgi:hypothetical protein
MTDQDRSQTKPSSAAAQPKHDAAGKKRLIRGIMLAVVAWGGFLATGMWLSTHNWRGPVFVMACVFAFLGFWIWMLSTRAKTPC